MRTEMLKIKMIVHKGKPNKSGRVPILMQLTIGQQTCHISTKQNILPEKWGDGKPIGHTREDQAITAVLEDIFWVQVAQCSLHKCDNLRFTICRS